MIDNYIKDCQYTLGNLKKHIYVLPYETTSFHYYIDEENTSNSYIDKINYDGGASLINCEQVTFTSTSSFEGNFSIISNLEVVINETNNFSYQLLINDFLQKKVYICFEDLNDNIYALSVEFPIKLQSYTKNFQTNNNQITLNFSIEQNIPSLVFYDVIKIKPTVIYNPKQCEYVKFNLKRFQMSDMTNTLIGIEDKKISVNDELTIKTIQPITNSLTFSENFNNDIYTYNVSFKVPLNEIKHYFHYNLLQFKNNTYCAYIISEMGNAFVIPNLYPSFNIETSEDDATYNTVTINLTTTSNYNICMELTEGELDEIINNSDDNSKFYPVYEFDQCIRQGIKAHVLVRRYNFKNLPTNEYMCLEGFEDYFSNYDIIGTYGEDYQDFGFDITWKDSSCNNFTACKINNLPSIVFFYGNETKSFVVDAECAWSIVKIPDNYQITPINGNIGQATITITHETMDESRDILYFQFDNEEVIQVQLISYAPTNIRYIEDGTLCFEDEQQSICVKWETLPYNPNDVTSYICESGDLYRKILKYVSSNCDGVFVPTNIYKKGELIETNSDKCTIYGQEVWIQEVEDEYICDEITK